MAYKDGRFRLVIYNGPPRSGKDTAVERVLSIAGPQDRVHTEKFAKPIKEATRKFYGLTRDQWAFWDSAANKDRETDVFLGKTCRQAQIAMSELFAKPFHGDKTVFGILLRNRICSFFTDGIIAISDSGFDEELWPLEDTFGASNILLVRIHREGHTFEGDSRKYVYPSRIPSLDVENNGTLEEFHGVVDGLVKDVFLEHGRWAQAAS